MHEMTTTHNLPSGTVTFLFTDIEGSTKLAQEFPDRWETLRARHHAILQSAMDEHDGYVFQIIGDGFCVAFHTANDALHAAIKSQTDLHNEAWDDTSIKVRMGIHTGKAEIQKDGQYHGYLAMSRVQRLMSAAHGGQALISAATQELLLEDLPENISLRDLGERRLKDLIRPEHIYQLVIPNLSVDFPPVKTLDVYRHNLPVQMTNFIGREKEMAEIKQAISKHRLVTLTGSGGAGKTRLSLQVAAELLDTFPEGVWFIELASLSDPELIPSTILSTLKVNEQQGKSALKVLEEYLESKEMLFVLDNCEHLIEAAAKVTNAVLIAAPNLKILANSREFLGVKGELAWHVPSLSLPDPKKLPKFDQLTQYEAVRLFIDRASLVVSHFEVNKENAPAIAQICHRLDGIPLAIELAAARTRMLSAEQISSHLDNRFRLLTGGSRTALPRQQTLRAMIDWSYDLLPENEKLLLCRLSIFAGGWTLELAEQICADEKIDSYVILDMLGRLVDKSLVEVDEKTTGTRYHILETVRQYAREKLLESGEGAAIRNKHRDEYLAFVERIEPELIRAQQNKWLHVLELEIDNLRAAFNWSLENKDAEQVIRFCSGLYFFWERKFHSIEATLATKQGLALANENDSLNTTFWYAATLLAHVVFTFDAEWKLPSDPFLLPLLKQADAIFNSINIYTTPAPVIAAQSIAWVYMDSNDLSLAETHLSELYEKVTASSYQWGFARTKISIAELSARKGDLVTWQKLFQEALELFIVFGDAWSVKDISQQLIWEKYLRGEFEEATRLSEQNILLYKEEGESNRVAWSYMTLGLIAFYQGRYEVAQQYFLDSAKISLELDDLLGAINPKRYFAFLLYKIGRLSEANAEYRALIALFKKTPEAYLYGILRGDYALLCLYENRLAEARSSLYIALGVLKKTSPETDIWSPYFGFGELARLEKNYREASVNYRACLHYANNYFNYKSFPMIFDGIAKTECMLLNFEKATHLFGFCEALRLKMGAVIHPVDRPDYDKHIALLKSKLGVEEFESAWAKGATMSIEETYQYAMQDGEE
jgi:predicted ATPase/class 3 adenylate cyclase